MKAARLTKSLLVAAACAAAIIACSSPSSGGGGAETVSLGAQSGAVTAGSAGAATYAVSTTNVPDGATGSFHWHSAASLSSAGTKPAWATPAVTAISGNAATVTITASSGAAAGTYYFSLVEDAAESDVATLVVGSAPPAKSVTVGAQNGVMADGIAGSVTFPVTTANIADATSGTVVWIAGQYDSTPASTPTGLGSAVSDLSGGAATVTVTSTSYVRGGSYYFRVLEGGATYSAIKKLAVVSTILTAQSGSLTAGTPGSATYTVLTTNIASGTTGTFAWYPDSSGSGAGSPTPPTGVTPSVTAVSAADSATATIGINNTAAAGAYYFRLTEGPATSAVKTLTIDAPKTVSISPADRTVEAGYYDSATYAVSTTGFSQGATSSVNWYSDAAGASSISKPTGISASAGPLLADGTTTITLTTSAPSFFGPVYLRLSVGGTLSNVASVTLVLGAPDSYGMHAYQMAGYTMLTWSGVVYATNYDIYKSTEAGTQGNFLANTTGVSYNDYAVASGNTYYYSVIAKDGSGRVSAPSGQVSAAY
jgi:hypothetical protein